MLNTKLRSDNCHFNIPALIKAQMEMGSEMTSQDIM